MSSAQPHMLQAYTPPLSLWILVEQHVPTFEQDEMKSMLGSHIVDQSLELHSEIEMLLEIWRDMRDDQKEGECSTGLPEPPDQRDRLIQEINFFVQNVKEKAENKGINPEHILKHHNKDIIEYASDLSRPGSSIGRASRLSDGRETPMMATSPDRVCREYEVSDEVEAVNDKLNVNDFDKVCAHLRSTLEKEVDQLVNDLEFLQGCLDNEADIRDSVTTPLTSREPTLTELREERASLEKELLLTDNLAALPEVQKRAFTSSTKISLPPTHSKTPNHPSPPPLKPTPVRAHHSFHGKWNSQHGNSTVAGEGHLPSGKDIPLKASHDIFTKASHSGREINVAHSNSVSVPGTHSLVPTPPTSAFRSDDNINKHVLPTASHIPTSNLPKATLHERSPRDGVLKARMSRGQKSASPSRIRVVNLNSIVDIQKDKRDNSAAEAEDQYEFVSPVSSNFGMQSDQGFGVRPTSADRFRKMVMGCRDGD